MNYYKILEVDQNSDINKIKLAYRKLAKKYHPDKGGNIDKFKEINDNFGHLIGDEALSTIGKVLRLAIRGNDTAGRIGGDEFAVILTETTNSGAIRVGRRIHRMLEESALESENGEVQINVSIGVCTLERNTFSMDEIVRPVKSEYFEFMYKNVVQSADDALYQAKRKGRNQLFLGKREKWQKG